MSKQVPMGFCMEKNTVKKAENILTFEDSYTRLPKLLELHSRMEQEAWLVLMGELWSTFDNTSEYKGELRERLGSDGPVDILMSDEERSRYKSLPEVIEVYRGCGPDNRDGVSWSLDKGVARKFPFLNRYKQVYPAVMTGTVDKGDVVALKLDRNENEIISFSVREIGIDMIYANPFTGELVPGYMN